MLPGMACRARSSRVAPFLSRRPAAPVLARLLPASTLGPLSVVCPAPYTLTPLLPPAHTATEGGAPPRGRFGGDRYGDDRRGYGGGRGGRYEDRGYRGYRDRDDRGGGYDRGYRDDRGGYDRGYRDDRGGGYDRGYRDDRGGYDRRDRDFEGGGGGGGGGGRIDRYASSGRDDRYGGGGGGGPRFDRAPPRDAPAPGGYGEGTRDYSLPRYGRD